MYLSGYGVELAIKSTEYKAVDDTQVKGMLCLVSFFFSFIYGILSEILLKYAVICSYKVVNLLKVILVIFISFYTMEAYTLRNKALKYMETL